MKQRNRSARTDLLTVAVLLAAAAVSGCSSENKEDKTYANSPKPELFSVPKEQMAHIQVLTVAPSTLSRVLRLPGTVAYNAYKTTPVITQVGGPVSRIVVTPGQHVNTRQPMLFISSPDYSQLRANYLKARDAYNLAHKSYVRAKDLYDHHANALRDLEAAESTESQAQADLTAAEQSLRILGISKPESLIGATGSPEVPLLAPLGGEVVERLCAPGQLITAGQTQCFTISDMSTVWVMVNVYENQLAYVHVGDSVTIKTDAYPKVFQGRISFLGAALDATSRTLQARIETSNPGDLLKKDMYVTAEVVAGNVKDAVVVPDSAVLRDAENEPFVYVATGQDAKGQEQFGRRKVKLGESHDGKTQIISGLQPGDRTVADGSLFLQFANSFQ
jgi:cobalt-zinc-cadmium efflux system membrane fusion protein